MRQILLALLLIGGAFGTSTAQLNMSLVGQLPYADDLNDIWGYAAPDGTEYALVGVQTGTSIVSLADPANPSEVAFIPGDQSVWRDLKTWNEHLYVTTDQGDDGLLVVDLSDLPNSAPFFYWTPDLPGLGVLETCHNIYIDEFGYAYLAGCNLNGGGNLVIDVFSEPGQPAFVSAMPAVYAHDIFVQNNIAFSSEIFAGNLSLYDVTDKNNVTLISNTTTPFDFTHNAWATADNNFVFTTDERPDAFVAAYDVSDPTDIIETDRYRPLETLGEGVIPHNVHVWQNWLVISYYTDGGIVVDATQPDNLIEVGNFDTFFGLGQGFQGTWGAYPFLPSGLVLLTDIGNGLLVVEPNYVNAAWLEGTVTDAVTGNAIIGANVEILDSGQLAFDETDLQGIYKTGQAIPGTFDVAFSALGYESATLSATLVNGEITILDAQLQPLPSFSVQVQVVDALTGESIDGAALSLRNDDFTFEGETDAQGLFSLQQVFEGSYDILAGAWGYLYATVDATEVQNNVTLTIELERGFRDDFALDYGWNAISAGASSGFWERGVPVGTDFQGQLSNPDADVAGDVGEQAYVTGNSGGAAGNDDVDGGTVTLISPRIDVSDMNQPLLHYRLWFFNAGGNGTPPDDELRVFLRYNNGAGTVLEEVEALSTSASVWRPMSTIDLTQFPEVNLENFRVVFETSDPQPNGHLVEGGVDEFWIEEGMPTATFDPTQASAFLRVSPNPTTGPARVEFSLDQPERITQLVVLDLLGRELARQSVSGAHGTVILGQDLAPGTYFVLLRTEAGQVSEAVKLVRQ